MLITSLKLLNTFMNYIPIKLRKFYWSIFRKTEKNLRYRCEFICYFEFKKDSVNFVDSIKQIFNSILIKESQLSFLREPSYLKADVINYQNKSYPSVKLKGSWEPIFPYACSKKDAKKTELYFDSYTEAQFFEDLFTCGMKELKNQVVFVTKNFLPSSIYYEFFKRADNDLFLKSRSFPDFIVRSFCGKENKYQTLIIEVKNFDQYKCPSSRFYKKDDNEIEELDSAYKKSAQKLANYNYSFMIALYHLKTCNDHYDKISRVSEFKVYKQKKLKLLKP